MKLRIDVTEADIDAGQRNCWHCPVALAGTRALADAGFSRHSIEYEPYRAFGEPNGLTVWHWSEGSDSQIAEVTAPYAAYEFASLFDDWRDGENGVTRDSLAPFTFEVELPTLEAAPHD